ncbi:uncharacterized protein [Elaeis guineensis]|uniref:uncharacterized protein n=1 Tax=Elaeis guineensis var. tenera TaxID=51953 RepID=UPI003C6D2059
MDKPLCLTSGNGRTQRKSPSGRPRMTPPPILLPATLIPIFVLGEHESKALELPANFWSPSTWNPSLLSHAIILLHSCCHLLLLSIANTLTSLPCVSSELFESWIGFFRWRRSMNTGRHQIFKLPKNSRKEQDEDLLLFREMFKREKERTMSLLQPVSDEFEPGHGNYPLYKISSSEKNDYDWLKTPPATPLFPSLEMEANDPDVVVHKELPVLRFFKPSRFSGQSVEPKHGQRPKSPSLKSSSSSRSVTPSTRPNSSSGKITLKGAPIPTDRPNKFMSNSNKRSNQLLVAPRLIKEAPTNSTITPKKSSETKPRGRGVSPLVRSTIPATILGFSSETPPNLITTASVIPSRASSATRGGRGILYWGQ